MADYRELLRRAVDALPENNGTSRRAVYEKAREALVTQLRAIEPPLPAREITQHRLTLEDCIRQVEQEATEALLQGLKQQTETPVVPVTEPQPVAPQQVEETPETVVEIPAEDEQVDAVEVVEPVSVEVEPEASEPEASQEEVTAQAEPEIEAEIESAPQELVDKPSETPSDTDKIAALLEAQAAGADEPATTPDPIVDSTPEQADVAEDEVTDVATPVQEDTTDEVEEPEPVSQPEVAVVPDATASEPEPIVISQDPAKVVQQPRNPVDDVIAAAQAASSAAAIVAPKVDVDVPAETGAEKKPAPSVEPALSSVREVEVDEALGSNEINVGGDEPQATIDRAIKALDLEAQGKDGSSLVPEDSKADDAEFKSQTVPFGDNLRDDLGETQIVEDEETGGNGLTVFLMLVVLLLAGAGGGAYWAWKEGFVDLNPLMAQLGLAETSTAPQTAQTTTNETPVTPDGAAVQSNVRDVTPSSATPNLTEPSTETTPVETQPTPAPVAPEQLTPEPAPATAENNETTTPDAAVVGEPAAPSDERLVADETTSETEQPQLNVGDPNAAAVQVGSRSLLIEEQLSGSTGAVPFSGETVWSRDVDELGSPVIKAAVSVPARNLTVNVLLRKNSDPALPASHLVEVNFSVTESFLGGGVASLPGILLKDQELAQGDPLIGASARIFDNSFLFALSAAETDLAKNLTLVSERGWIDLPVVYSTGRKAIVTMEKGKDGNAIFEAVLAAWAAQ